MSCIQVNEESRAIQADYVFKNNFFSPGTALYVGKSGGSYVTMYCDSNPQGMKVKPNAEDSCKVWFSAKRIEKGLYRHMKEETNHTCTAKSYQRNRKREYNMKILKTGETLKVLDKYTVPQSKAVKHLDSALQAHAGLILKPSQLKGHVRTVSNRTLLDHIKQLQLIDSVRDILMKVPDTTFVVYKTICSYVETDIPMYDGIYLALGDMKRVYKYLPRWGAFDAAHMNTVSGGVLQFLTTYNANGHLELLAISTASKENGPYWNRFKELSDSCFPNMSAYLVDKEKGIHQSIVNSVHQVQARTCILHIIKNVMNKGLLGRNDKPTHQSIIAMTKAATEQGYIYHAQSIRDNRELGDKIMDYLESPKEEIANYLFVEARREHNAVFTDPETGSSLETRIYNSYGSVYGQITSNVVEQANFVHLDMRSANIVDMLILYSNWHMRKRKEYQDEARQLKSEGKQVTPWAVEKTIAHLNKLKPCTVTIVSNAVNGDWFDCQVNFKSHSSTVQTCSVKLVRSRGIIDCESCNLHVSEGIPCGHAAKCFVHIAKVSNVNNIASDYNLYNKCWYSRFFWVETYILQTSFTGQSMSFDFENMEQHSLLPCPTPRPAGRPKKRYEKSSRRNHVLKKTITCSKCGEAGHNINTCNGDDNSYQLRNLRSIRKLIEDHESSRQKQTPTKTHSADQNKDTVNNSPIRDLPTTDAPPSSTSSATGNVRRITACIAELMAQWEQAIDSGEHQKGASLHQIIKQYEKEREVFLLMSSSSFADIITSVPDAENNPTPIQTETSPVKCDMATSAKTGSSIVADKECTSSQMRTTASNHNDNDYASSSELPGKLEHQTYQAEIHASGALMREKLAANRIARLAAKRSKTLGKSRVLMTSKNKLHHSTLLRKRVSPSTISSGNSEHVEKKRKEIINVDTNVVKGTVAESKSFYVGGWILQENVVVQCCKQGEWIKGSLISGVFYHLSQLPSLAVRFCDADAHRVWMKDLYKYRRAESLRLKGPPQVSERISVLIPWNHSNAHWNLAIVTLYTTNATVTILDGMPNPVRADEQFNYIVRWMKCYLTDNVTYSLKVGGINQHDSFSCGVLLCAYARAVSENPQLVHDLEALSSHEYVTSVQHDNRIRKWISETLFSYIPVKEHHRPRELRTRQ